MKSISSILVMILFISPCFAKEARGFTITIPDFNSVYDDFFQYGNPNVYEVNNTDKSQEISENAKTDNSSRTNQVLTATQMPGVVLNIDKAYFSKNSKSGNKTNKSDNSAAFFRITTSFFYPAALTAEWKNYLNGIISADLAFFFAESRYGIFGFSPGIKFGYSYFDGKNGYELNYHLAYFSFPLDFSFYIAESRKIIVSFGPYYSFEFLKFQEKYKNPETNMENHIGLDAEIKFSQNISSFLDIGFALGAFYPFEDKSFSVARAGILLDWRL